jgi:hypothetical protein
LAENSIICTSLQQATLPVFGAVADKNKIALPGNLNGGPFSLVYIIYTHIWERFWLVPAEPNLMCYFFLSDDTFGSIQVTCERWLRERARALEVVRFHFVR